MRLALLIVEAWFIVSAAGISTVPIEVTTNEPGSCERDGNCTTIESGFAQPNATTVDGVPAVHKNLSLDEKRTEHDRGSQVCTCDLQERYCDVNCCCDTDCDRVDKRTLFGYCDVDGRDFYDDRYCDYVRHVYVNNTAFEWRVKQGGLFCVVKSNAPKSFIVQRHEPIRAVDDLTRHGLRNVWNASEWRSRGGFGPGRKMTYGDPIWLLTGDGRFEKLAVPRRFLTPNCMYDEDVAYLKSTESSCGRTGTEPLSLSAYVSDRKVVIKPHLFNATDNRTNTFTTCPEHVCRAIDVAICRGADFENCTRLDAPPTPCSGKTRKTNATQTCRDAVERIRYVVRHNGSEGIDSVRADVILRSHNAQQPFVQYFQVIFYWTGQTANYSIMRSGNPGYLPGRPVVAAVRYGAEIRRNSTAFADNFLTLPGAVRGRCASRISIEFGYHTVAKCAFRVNANRDKAACRRIQAAILDAWGVSNKTSAVVAVGLFGDADASRLADWTDVLDVENASVVLNRTGGVTDGATLTCRRLATSLFVDVVYARVDFERLKEQNKILGVTRRFRFENLTFGVGVETDIDLRGAVSFHDVTAPKRRRFVEPPRLEIRLPYDFFYPFVRIGNAAAAGVATLRAVFMGCVLALLVN